MLTPLQQVNAPVTSVMMPVLSRLRDDAPRYRQAYLRAVSLLLTVTLPAITFFLISADPLIPFTLGEEWRPAAAVFAWLALAGLHQPMTGTTGWLFISQHRSLAFAALGVASAVVSIAAFLIGVRYGLRGIAEAYALSNFFIVMPMSIWWVGRAGPVSSMDIVRMALPQAVATMVSLATLYGLETSLKVPAWALLALMLPASYLAYWAGLFITSAGRSVIADASLLISERSGFARRVLLWFRA
jgi:PST family polysaccharide transporter